MKPHRSDCVIVACRGAGLGLRVQGPTETPNVIRVVRSKMTLASASYEQQPILLDIAAFADMPGSERGLAKLGLGKVKPSALGLAFGLESG